MLDGEVEDRTTGSHSAVVAVQTTWYQFADPAQEIELPWTRKKPKPAIEWKKNEAVDNGTDAGGAGLGSGGSQRYEGREEESQSVNRS